jgi:hypothetical protein
LLAGLPQPPAIDDVARLLAHHDAKNDAAFCRHGGGDLSTTISGAIYCARERRMYAALGNPCETPWRRFDLMPAASAAAA